jgi:hypothetical protein
MQGSEFTNYFVNVPIVLKYFKTVCSIDSLVPLKIREFLICNTAKAEDSGEHWFIIFKSARNSLEIFDSLGVDENKEQKLLSYINFNVKKLIFNQSQFQSNDTDTCGKFCFFFIVQRLHNLDLNYDEFLEEMFVKDPETNEKIVNEFCDNLLND